MAKKPLICWIVQRDEKPAVGRKPGLGELCTQGKVTPLDRQPIDDWELIALCRKRDKRCFDVLIKRHLSLVMNLSYRFLLDAELAREATQDIFLKVYESLDKVADTGRPFQNWLCSVTANHCRNVFRRRKRECELLERGVVRFWYEGSPFVPPTFENLEAVEAASMVDRALAQVSYDERSALVLWNLTGLSTKELSKVFKVPQYVVRRRLRRAKDKVRRILLQEELVEYARVK